MTLQYCLVQQYGFDHINLSYGSNSFPSDI